MLHDLRSIESHLSNRIDIPINARKETTMKIQSLAGQWQFRQAGTVEWLPATVPGSVHTDLLVLGMIPDPFVGDNEKRWHGLQNRTGTTAMPSL